MLDLHPSVGSGSNSTRDCKEGEAQARGMPRQHAHINVQGQVLQNTHPPYKAVCTSTFSELALSHKWFFCDRSLCIVITFHAKEGECDDGEQHVNPDVCLVKEESSVNNLVQGCTCYRVSLSDIKQFPESSETC